MPWEARLPGGEPVGSAGAIGLTLGLSLLHAALPNHWFPFVVVGRAQRWTRRKTLGVLALAGGGHVVATSALGLIVWLAGEAVLRRLGNEALERWGAWIAGGLLVLLGIVFVLRQAFSKGHHHSHAHGSAVYHHHDLESLEREARMSDRAAIVTLFLALTFSPCEAVVIAFASAWKFGPRYALVLAVSASLATVTSMFVLTWLTLAGRERLRFPWLDRNEMALTGWILVAIGLVVLFVPT